MRFDICYTAYPYTPGEHPLIDIWTEREETPTPGRTFWIVFRDRAVVISIGR